MYYDDKVARDLLKTWLSPESLTVQVFHNQSSICREIFFRFTGVTMTCLIEKRHITPKRVVHTVRSLVVTRVAYRQPLDPSGLDGGA